ncbi:unnamed protein product [Allacma fusca]|uniref:JmjC domain-containing protein 5 n=1 Tax=Allacma fusca TaxID=39272 RepID=A0A8J2JSY3_9HEXA|nr:unnamed protein product [Allacma fusca]
MGIYVKVVKLGGPMKLPRHSMKYGREDFNTKGTCEEGRMSCKEKVRIVQKLMPNFCKDVSEEIECARGKLAQMKDRSVGIIMKRALLDCGRVLSWGSNSEDDGMGDLGSGEVTTRVEELDVVIEFIWEQLNTGHWKQVPEVWRKLYAYATLFKVILLLAGDVPTSEVIKVCDLGLLLGAPILNNIMSKIAFRLHVSQNASLDLGAADARLVRERHLGESSFVEGKQRESVLRNQFPSRFQLGELLRPSIETFVQEYFLPQKPVLLRGVIEHWSAMQKWNVDYIKQRAGSRTVPIEIGSKYTSEEWTQKLVTMDDFIDNYVLASSVAERSKGYLAQHQLFLQIPELLQDLGIPEYCYVGNDEDIEINAWFGPAGTVSPTHYDPKHNLLTQIFGEKIIRLFPPSEWNKLYPHDSESMLFNTSQIDVEDPNFSTEFPNSARAKYADVVLEPGTVLYMPPKWAHFVKSLSPSFSVSFWFQ